MTRRYRSGRVRVKIGPDGRALLAGLSYDDLRSILTSAAIHRYEALKKAELDGDPLDHISWHKRQLKILELLKERLGAAIEASHGPRGPVSRSDRLQRVLSDRKFRHGLNDILGILRNRERL